VNLIFWSNFCDAICGFFINLDSMKIDIRIEYF